MCYIVLHESLVIQHFLIVEYRCCNKPHYRILLAKSFALFNWFPVEQGLNILLVKYIIDFLVVEPV